MMFWHELNDGPGYSLDGLTADELGQIHTMITSLYLDGIQKAAPELTGQAAAVGIAMYHTLPIRFDHESFWAKQYRVLPVDSLPAFAEMGFFRRIRAQLPSSAIYHDDLMWRLVRPGQPSDIGPIHADKWFWDAGNGSIPAGHERFKIWIALVTEPGLNGLLIKPDSHASTQWKHHYELKHGKMKPVLDETPEDLRMELLPLKPGEMVFFHDGLLHGGALNRGSTCRVSLELTVIYRSDEGSRLTEQARRPAACRGNSNRR